MKTKWLLLSTLLLSTASFAQAKRGLDVNDATFLFPLDANRQVFPAVTLAASEKQTDLISKGQLDEMIAAAKARNIALPAGISFEALADWHVVAYRYDPCSPDTRGPKESECMQELRLVAQPFSASGPADTAMHIVYDLGHGLPKADDAVLADLLALNQANTQISKVQTAGRPLGVHPVLVEALKSDKAMAQPIVDFLRRHAKVSQLKKLTMMGLKNASESSWIFFGGDIVEGRWQIQGVANLPADELSQVELDLNSTDRVFFPIPVETKASTYGFFHRETLVEGDIEALRETLHTLENPALTNRNTTDCLSCHSATTIKLNANTRAPRFVAGQTSPVPKGITAYPEARTLQRHRLHWNLRALGYFGVQPSLSMRTVNEAGAVADRVNAILGLTNPGPDCSGQETTVLSCFENATPNPAVPAGEIEKDCLKVCQAAPQFDESEKPSSTVDGKPSLLDRSFSLVSRYSDLCLEPQKANDADGSLLTQARCTGDARQRFRVESFAEDPATVRLVHEASARCVDIVGPSLTNGTKLHLWSCHAGLSQALRVKASAEDSFTIELLHSSKCVDIEGPSLVDGTRLHQWSCLGNSSQHWFFRP